MNDPTPEENAPERPNPPDGSRKQFRPLRAVKPKLIAVLWVAFLAPEIGNTEVSSNLPKPGEARMIHFEGALPKVKAKSAELQRFSFPRITRARSHTPAITRINVTATVRTGEVYAIHTRPNFYSTTSGSFIGMRFGRIPRLVSSS